jgi:hypothetical protein
MTKHIFSFCVASFLLFSLVCQGQRVYLGLKGGLNYSSPRGEYTSGKWLFKPGTDIGIIAGCNITDHLSVQSGVDYTNLNYRLLGYSQYMGYSPLSNASDIIAISYDYSRRWNLKYFRVPVLARYSFGNRLKFMIEAGYYWGFFNRGGGEYYPLIYLLDSSRPMVNDYSGNVGIKARSRDRGLLFGTGLQYHITTRILTFFDANWATGSKQIWNDDWNSFQSRNGSVHLTVGIAFGIGKLLQNKSATDSVSNLLTLGKLRLVPHAGAVISSHSGDDAKDSYSQKAGLVTGIAMEYPLRHHWLLQSALNFERKGYIFDATSWLYFRYVSTGSDFPKVSTKVNLDYFEIPLLIGRNWGKTVRFSLGSGPYIAFLLNAQCMGTAYSEYFSDTYYSESVRDINDNVQGAFKKVDVGWVLSGGMEVPLERRWSVLVDMGYYRGFTDIFRDKLVIYSGPEYDKVSHNQSFVCTLGISYHL